MMGPEKFTKPSTAVTESIRAKGQREVKMLHLSRRHVLAVAGFAIGTPATADEAHLAIQGYDSVAYFTDHKPVMGSSQYQAEWNDKTYRFAAKIISTGSGQSR
jgi:hypothetical protein